MVKKASHIVLATLLIVITTGMTVSKHYCGNDLKSITVSSGQHSCCETPSGCCHDESQIIQIKDYFSVCTLCFDFTQLAVILPVIVDNRNNSLQCELKTENINSPPPKIQTVLSSLQTYLL
ncbi:hypothetical protein MNBD_BACTEROID01-1143 [hydrothermal vent metagenome]|uniref:Uncharacterized protein n=1 Tax=hydrothermal vent metagenome TaxID=652676 RepID=A0A3B0TQ91_9ZZZZ